MMMVFSRMIVRFLILPISASDGETLVDWAWEGEASQPAAAVFPLRPSCTANEGEDEQESMQVDSFKQEDKSVD